MENVLFEAGCEIWINKPGFNGLKTFKIKNDILYLDFFDGMKFSSPIMDLQVRVTRSWYLLRQPFIGRIYKLTTSDGKKITLGSLYDNIDFLGFYENTTDVNSHLKADHKVWEIYDVLDSLPNTQNSALEILRLIVAWGSLVIFVIFIGLLIIL